MVATLLAIFSQFSKEVMAQRERSFIMVKPDGVQRGLVGEIIKRFEQKGFKLVAMKFMQVISNTANQNPNIPHCQGAQGTACCSGLNFKYLT